MIIKTLLSEKKKRFLLLPETLKTKSKHLNSKIPHPVLKDFGPIQGDLKACACNMKHQLNGSFKTSKTFTKLVFSNFTESIFLS